MPDLELLYLENAIRGGRYNSESASLGAEKVRVPRLAHLLVAAPFSRLVRFLSCIDTPATTQVRLGCRLETRRSDQSIGTTFFACVEHRDYSSIRDVGHLILRIGASPFFPFWKVHQGRVTHQLERSFVRFGFIVRRNSRLGVPHERLDY